MMPGTFREWLRDTTWLFLAILVGLATGGAVPMGMVMIVLGHPVSGGALALLGLFGFAGLIMAVL